jgi:hypothetical protein
MSKVSEHSKKENQWIKSSLGFYQQKDRGLGQQTVGLKGMLLHTADWADLPKNKLFSTVTRLKADPMEFSYPLDQRL